MIDRKLNIFRMAAVLNNFTEAAAALGMTQPNVTQQIAQLERELGHTLFERDGRQVHLTPAGRTLLQESEKLLNEAEQLICKIHNAASEIRQYRLGATMTAGGYVLPKLLAQYMRKHPEVNLDLHIANTNEIADMLKKHRLDMALVEGPFDKKCFFYEPLLEDELVAVGAPGFAEKELSLADYLEKGKRLILRETGSGTRWHFDCFRQEHNLPPPRRRCILEISGFDAIKQLVRSGFGISVMSELAIQDELAAGTLSKARFMEGPIRRSINFIYMPNENLKFAEDFISFCRKMTRKSLEKRQK